MPYSTPLLLPLCLLLSCKDPANDWFQLTRTVEIVCQKRTGVAGTAPYQKGVPGLHPAVIFTQSQAQSTANLWSPIPEGGFGPWKPTKLASTELVACLREVELPIEVCDFGGGNTLSRTKGVTNVALLEAATGAVVAQFVVEGKEPPPCPTVDSFSAGSGGKNLRGESPNTADIRKGLAPFVEIR